MVPQHLQGLRGLDLVVGILVTLFFIPFWLIGAGLDVADRVRSWWWNR